MNYKIYIYVISLFLSAYAVSGINFENIIRKNKVIEARVLMMLLSFSFAYLISNFFINFMEYSKIL